MGVAMSSRRFEPLQQLADLREDHAARALVDAQRALDERAARLAELQSYRAEYERQPGGAATLQLMRNRQVFIERLREAERFQQQLVEQARLAVDTQRAEWLVQQRGAKTIAQLTATYQQRERREVERREQNRADELAAQRHERRAVERRDEHHSEEAAALQLERRHAERRSVARIEEARLERLLREQETSR